MRILLMLLLAVVSVRAAKAECPASTVSVLAGYPEAVTYTTSAPSNAASSSFSGCQPHPNICWSASAAAGYDLVAGTAYANANGSNTIPEASVSTHDVFTLLGPSSAAAITFVARVHVVIWTECYAAAGTITVREGASNSASANHIACGLNETDIEVSITRAANATFDLYLTNYARGGSGFQTSGQAYTNLSLSFPDLPPGYSVMSCQGFMGGAVVPTKRGSWGRVKAVYR